MANYKRICAFGVLCFFVAGVAFAEVQQGAQPVAPMLNLTPQQPSSSNNIKTFDDKVFDISGGTVTPETRTSAGGTTRYLDKTKDLDYNTEQYERWKKECGSDAKCFNAKKNKELGSRTNFGGREPRSGSDGLNRGGARNGIRPQPGESASEPETESESSGSGDNDSSE